jgi:hypothetical protein
VVLSLTGFLCWVFVVPPLARSSVTGDAATRAAVDAAWTAQHQYGGALRGEHLGELLVIGWSATLCVIIVRALGSCPAGSASPSSCGPHPQPSRAGVLSTASPRDHHPARMPLTPARR